jgi:hypothetical protein
MGGLRKSLALFLVLIFLTSLITIPPAFVKASTFDNDIGHKLLVVNPDSNIAYNGTMPLNFNVDWSANNSVAVQWLFVQFFCNIDDNVTFYLTEGSTLNFESSSVVTTTFNDLVNISYLASGLHKLTIIAKGTYDLDNNSLNGFNYSFSPIYFSVNTLSTPTLSPSSNPTLTSAPTSTPTNTGFFTGNNAMLLGAVLIVAVIAIGAGLLVYFKKRKH